MSINVAEHLNPNVQEQRNEIYNFVVDFYSRVRKDEELGPIFNNKIGDHWDAHFQTLTDFWMTVLLGIHSYKGNPFLAHHQTPGIENRHFDIWLAIFAESANQMLEKSLAEIAIEKSVRIAGSLRQGLFFRASKTAP